MAGAPPRRRDSPPALPDELVEEILLRLPPDEPAWLLRASLISKDWGRAISSPAFRRRLHEFHRTPPVLGFLHDWDDGSISHFIPTTASSFSLPAPDWRSWRAIDCRHGRALFLPEDQGAQELLVWEPITGAQRRVPVPLLFETFRVLRNTFHGSVTEMYPGAAVFCAADGCDHRDCHGGPFGLVFVFTIDLPDDDGGGGGDGEEEEEEFHIWACVFSSETGTWGKPTLMQSEFNMVFIDHYSVLLGRSLLYFMYEDELILQYDLASHSLTALDPPDHMSGPSLGRFNIMLTEDGGLGVTEYSNPNIKLWTREASDDTDAQWVLSRVINLVNLLPMGALLADSRVRMVGFAEGTNTIFLNTVAGIFTVELQSEKARKVCDRRGFGNLVPVVSFYTPVPRGEHQDPPQSGPRQEAGGEEGGEKEKAIEQPQQLFNKGSNAIEVEHFLFAAGFNKWSNAIEEEDFVSAGFSHALKTRVLSHGEVATESAGTALLCRSQAMNDPLDDVPRSASNEESVTGTTSKDDAGDLKTSGSNVEDAAPPAKKGESKEVLRR